MSLCCFAAGAVIADEVRMNLVAEHDEFGWGIVVCRDCGLSTVGAFLQTHLFLLKTCGRRASGNRRSGLEVIAECGEDRQHLGRMISSQRGAAYLPGVPNEGNRCTR